MATKKKKTIKKPKKKTTSKNMLRDEVIILLMLAFCILLLISNFGIGGFIGGGISSFVFGIFGLPAYAIPILLFLGVSFWFSNRGNKVAYLKVIAGKIFVFMVCTFIQITTIPFEKEAKILSYYKVSSLEKNGGGIVGGLFAKLLCPAFGIIGAYVVMVIIMIICLVVITEKSVLKKLKSGGTQVYSSAKKDMKLRQEANQKKKEAREIKRKEERSLGNGVSFNTTLSPKTSEMKEILPPEETQTSEVLTEGLATSELSLDDAFTIESSPKYIEPVETVKKPQEEVQDAKKSIVKINEHQSNDKYQFPSINLLKAGNKGCGESTQHQKDLAIKLQQTLKSFGVNVTITNISCGPSVTRYELQPEQGVKVSKIVGLADDIKLNLAASDIRIEAPIPGKAAVGIEVPNKNNAAVMLRDLIEDTTFKNSPSKLSFAVGKDIAGKVVVADIMKMPHVLIAGATGSGKSVCINTLIMSILYKASPEEVKLIMIDPKVVELSVYNGIPHLMIPVVTDPKKAAGALQWGVNEMTKRYQLFAEANVRDLAGYNKKIESISTIEDEEKPKKLPQIVIIVDELADLMMVAPSEVENSICRLAQLARAAGIHLVLATQRPSVNVITGLIKANMPSRIAFSVSSGVDSRTIIDMNGAEKLLGKGDMLFYPAGYPKPARVQGSFVSDKEVQDVVNYLVKQHGNADYDLEIEQEVSNINLGENEAKALSEADERDAYFEQAGLFIIDKEKASIGMLQRVFKIGFNRAARIMDQLYDAGVVGAEDGTKPRKVLMSQEQFNQFIEQMQ